MEYLTNDLFVGISEFPQDDLSLDQFIGNSISGWPELNDVISLLPEISLEEMTGVKLMNRTDVKYLMKSDRIPVLLKKIVKDYHIQEISGKRVAEYGTRYLDTDELQFYHLHMNGKLNHIKWRIRSYIESNLNFLEIKKKSNTGRTRKNRIVLNPSNNLMDEITADFIRDNSGLEPHLLHSVLENNFKRITLVNNNKTERLTIDFNISFINCINGKSVHMQDLAIIEIKQNRLSESAIRKYLDEMRIKKSGLSKYCLGIALTHENIKRNLYKRKIRYIHKITTQK